MNEIEKMWQILCQQRYEKLISSRKKRIDDVKGEWHHILPKSMGGSNDADNLVKLTYREHFLAHWLLWMIHRTPESSFAFECIRKMGKAKLSSRDFAIAKEAGSLGRKHLASKRGKKYWNSLTPEEIFDKQSYTSRQRWEKLDKQQRFLQNSAIVSKSWSNLTEDEKSLRAKSIWDKRRKFKRNCPGCHVEILYSNLDTLNSCESKKSLCKSCFEKSDKISTCPHCQKAGSGNAMKRWHFKKCKLAYNGKNRENR